MNKAPDKVEKPNYQAIKTSLKRVVKHPFVIEKLTNIAFMANKIVIHSLQFLKLYLIHCKEADNRS